MLHLCPKCPAYVCLSESALFLPSLLLASHLSHIIEIYSVLPLKIGYYFMPFFIMSYIFAANLSVICLKSECKESCSCRCILPVCLGYRPGSREHGMLQHEAFGLSLSLERLSSSQQPAVHCSSCPCCSWAGIPSVLGLRHSGHDWLCSMAVKMPLSANPLWIAFTQPWLSNSLHNNQVFGRENPNAGCGISCRWLYEGDDTMQPGKI